MRCRGAEVRNHGLYPAVYAVLLLAVLFRPNRIFLTTPPANTHADALNQCPCFMLCSSTQCIQATCCNEKKER